jgi:hypothetical protein
MGDAKKKSIFKRWWFWLIVVLIIAGIGAAGGENGSDTNTAEPASTEPQEQPKENEEKPKEEKPKMAGIGETIKVGDVAFTVHGTSTAKNVGGEFGSNAQGTFLVVDVSVKNEGKEAITTDSSFFKLKVGDVEYEASGEASIYANEDTDFFLQKVNPGLENRGKVVFDVPDDVVNASDVILNVQTGFWGTEQGQIKLSK